MLGTCCREACGLTVCRLTAFDNVFLSLVRTGEGTNLALIRALASSLNQMCEIQEEEIALGET